MLIPTVNLKSSSCNGKTQQQNLTKAGIRFLFVSSEGTDTAITADSLQSVFSIKRM